MENQPKHFFTENRTDRYQGFMALKITLKPNEKIFIGGAVIRNGDARVDFFVENNVPILRQKSILTPGQADTPARKIYFNIQLMYIDPSRRNDHQKTYWQLVRDFVRAAPSSLALIDRINELIYRESFYQALGAARNLIEFEQEVIERATKCSESLSIS
jgi:flagellar protein FlbT